FCFVVSRVHYFRLGLGRGCRVDLDFARLQQFRKLADEIDRQQAVLQLGAGDANVVSEAEAALKAAFSDAAMQEVALLRRLALTSDEERVLLELNAQVVFAEAGDGQFDAEIVFADLFDVEGRITRRSVEARSLVHQARNAVKADERAIKRVQFVGSHLSVLLKRQSGAPGGGLLCWLSVPEGGGLASDATPAGRRTTGQMGRPNPGSRPGSGRGVLTILGLRA